MSVGMANQLSLTPVTFVEHLSRYTPADWASAIGTLAPEIHPVDLDAARVWLAFYPNGPGAGRIDASHSFLYGHRYWPQVRRAVLAAAKETAWPGVLPELLDRIADHATRTTQVDRDQLLGVTAASLVTLRHAGLDAFAASAGTVQLPHRAHVRSIRQVRRARAHQKWRPFGALFGRQRFRMTFEEGVPDASFDVIDGGTIASGMTEQMHLCGNTCSGACAIGVLGGAEYLSEIEASEQETLDRCGYRVLKSVAGYPLIRLACYARPAGDVSLVMRSHFMPEVA